VPPSLDKLKFPTEYLHANITFKDNSTTTNATQQDRQEQSQKKTRRKRQAGAAGNKIEPELLLFCDNAMVQQFEGDTDELLEYLLHFWHAVSLPTGQSSILGHFRYENNRVSLWNYTYKIHQLG